MLPEALSNIAAEAVVETAGTGHWTLFGEQHLRNTDRTAFRHTAIRLLTSDNLRRLLALPSWFEAATGRWEKWLAAAEAVPLVLPQLEWSTAHHPARVTELLEPYRDAEGPWRQRLLSWAQSRPSVHAQDLILALIDRGDFDVASARPSETEADFWYLFELLAQKDAGVALRVGSGSPRAVACSGERSTCSLARSTRSSAALLWRGATASGNESSGSILRSALGSQRPIGWVLRCPAPQVST